MYKVIGLVMALCLLTGCQSAYEAQESNAADMVYSMADSIDLFYEVPVSHPNILVDQEGYRIGSKKIAVFKGEQLPRNFYVIDKATNKQVYSGRIESKGQGVFTDLDLPGEYYIEADYIGQSYSFKIGSNLYENTFEKACGRFTGGERDDYRKMPAEDICYVLTNLLTAYELYEEEFHIYAPEFLENLRDYTDSLLALQDSGTGRLEEAASDNTTAYAAAVLAKYSYLIRETDANYANECMKAGKKAWTYVSRTKDTIEENYSFYAAAELYRLTGNSMYHIDIEDFLEKGDSPGGGITDPGFYGEITYLITRGKVDISLCDAIMNRIMEEAETISEDSRSQPFLVCTGEGREDIQGMLSSMVKMAVVDYVISNHEYATVLENHLHYLLGRNPACVSFIEGYGKVFTSQEELNILADPKYNSAFVFMMSAIEKHEEDVE